MTGSLNQACPLCGLRYDNSPLLELHIREDHRRRISAQPGHGRPGNTQASQARANSRGDTADVPSGPSLTTKEATVMTTSRRPWERIRTAPRRAIGAFLRINDEFLRASEAIIRSARAPRARPRGAASANGQGHPRAVAERADRAA
jgi:hypothetical protein